MGLKSLPPGGGELLLEIILRRHETRSTIMTSNRPVDEWGKLPGDVPTAGAKRQAIAGRQCGLPLARIDSKTGKTGGSLFPGAWPALMFGTSGSSRTTAWKRRRSPASAAVAGTPSG